MGLHPLQPTLYLHGTQDGCVAIDDAALADVDGLLSKGSEVGWVQGAGHFLLVEKPGEANDRILRFLETEV